MQVGIIGYGRFGRLAAKVLASRFELPVVVAWRRREPGLSGGVRFVTLDEACKSSIIIPCVPISAFEDIIRSIAPKLKPGSLVVDVCSVKVYPVEIMEKYLPADIGILATHPNFGPDSARRGLKSLKIVLHPVRISPDRYEKVRQACRTLGLDIIEMGPEEHDRLAAYSLAYTHLVGRIGQKMKIGNTPIDTKGFAQLMKVQGYVVNDTYDLFRDMQAYNPYAREMRQRFGEAFAEIERELGGQSRVS